MRRNGFSFSLSAAHRLDNRVNILRDICDFHFKRVGLRILKEYIIELVNETPGCKLDITEVKNYNVLLTILNKELEVINPQP